MSNWSQVRATRQSIYPFVWDGRSSILRVEKTCATNVFNRQFLHALASIVDLLVVVLAAIPFPLLPRFGPLHVVNALLVALLPLLDLVLVEAGFA